MLCVFTLINTLILGVLDITCSETTDVAEDVVNADQRIVAGEEEMFVVEPAAAHLADSILGYIH